MSLPLPYEPYSHFNRCLSSTEEEHNKKMKQWVDSNIFKCSLRSRLEYYHGLIDCPTKTTNQIYNWMVNHLDKMVYLPDFSGVCMGISFCEAEEMYSLTFPRPVHLSDKILYENLNYNEEEFSKLPIIEKLNWMYQNCDFIPFRVIYEGITIYSEKSYKYSHIKRNASVMRILEDYLKSINFAPKDNNFYYICFNNKSHVYYLKRDWEKSPNKWHNKHKR